MLYLLNLDVDLKLYFTIIRYILLKMKVEKTNNQIKKV